LRASMLQDRTIQPLSSATLLMKCSFPTSINPRVIDLKQLRVTLILYYPSNPCAAMQWFDAAQLADVRQVATR
jgi:hypothetical protein